MRSFLARPFRRAIFVAALAALAASPGGAQLPAPQVRVSWDANAGATQFESRINSGAPGVSPSDQFLRSKWLGQRAMGGAIRVNHPFAQLSADARLRDGDVSTRATGGFSALVASPSWKGVRVSLSTVERHFPYDANSVSYDDTSLALRAAPTKVPTWQSFRSIGIAYARNNSGVWFRANQQQGVGTSDSLSPYSLTTGYAHQLGDIVLGLSLNSRSVYQKWGITDFRVTPPQGSDSAQTDTLKGWRRFSDVGASFGWGRGRLAFDATFNLRPRIGTLQQSVWGEAAAAAAVGSRVALIAALRTAPRLPGVENNARRTASLGLRVAGPALWRTTVEPPLVRSVSRAFNVMQSAPGQYVITVSVPNARTVELAGDFTKWESVSLRQVNANRWEIRLPVNAGSHRCNIRIDGAEWVPPPGVPSVNDEFNGRVGLFVAQ